MPTPRGLVQQLDQELHRSNLLPRRARLAVAVSGGADSVALLRLLHAINQSEFWQWTLVVGHVNHKLRGGASDGDAAFVQGLARSLGVPCITRSLKLGAGGKLHVSEAAARTARFRALSAVVRDKKCHAAVFAHHADDQAETVLLRLFRGAGLSGLGGMSPDSSVGKLRILRPLLHLRRADLRAYLRSVRQDFREDHTNVQDVYARNRLRKILPRLESVVPGAVGAVVRTASLARQAQGLIEHHLGELRQGALIVQTPRRVHFHRGPLKACDPFLAAELLRDAVGDLRGSTESADFERITHAVRLIQSSASGKEVELGRGVTLHVARETVTLARGRSGR